MDQSATELREDIAETRANLGETLEAIGDRVSPGRMVERRRNRMTRGFADVKNRIMGTASSMSHEAADATSDAMHKVEQTPEMLRERTAGSPLIAGGVAFGIGALIAAAIPPSRTEREVASTVGEKIEPLKEEATAMARDVADKVQEGAKEAVEEVKEVASESASHVADTVKGDQGSGSSSVSTGATGTTDSGDVRR